MTLVIAGTYNSMIVGVFSTTLFLSIGFPLRINRWFLWWSNCRIYFKISRFLLSNSVFVSRNFGYSISNKIWRFLI